MEASAINGATAPSPAGSQKALSSDGPHDLRPPEESPAGVAAAPFDSDAT
jgi:hypothetical protein